MRSDVTHQYRGLLGTLDGQTLTVALMDPGYIPGPDDTTLASIAGDEIDVGGYSRQTVTASWNPTEGELSWDAPPVFDVDGADEIATVVTADPSGLIVTWHSWDTPVAGQDGMAIDLPVLARFVAVGGVRQVVAGENVTVDDDDPARPVISATGNGGGGGGGGGLSPAPPVTVDGPGPVAQVDLTGLPVDAGSVVLAVPPGVTGLEVTPPDVADRMFLEVAVIGSGVDSVEWGGQPLMSGSGETGVVRATVVDLGELGPAMWVARWEEV